MKLYVGVRTELDRRVVVTSSTGQFADYSLSIVELNDLQGFRWGSGSAAGLALAILSDHLESEVRDSGLCHRFEEALIATLPPNFWVLSEREVAAAVERFGAELS
jgi:hypothetical protein